MSDLPLFYRTVIPINRDSHRALALSQPQRFGFARASHVVPAVVDEFGQACRHLPILFLVESLGPTPVFLTGFKPGRSSLIDEGGTWTGRYLPAYLRRYPFILGEVEGAQPLICFDETADAFAPQQETGGASETAMARSRLFDDEGGDTALLAERVRLVIDYAAAAKRTAAFGRSLQDLAMLRPVTVEGSDAGSGQAHAPHGFLGIDETALGGLPQAGFERLRNEGWLAMIYAHLVSLQAIADFTLTFAPGTTPPAARDPSMLGAAV